MNKCIFNFLIFTLLIMSCLNNKESCVTHEKQFTHNIIQSIAWEGDAYVVVFSKSKDKYNNMFLINTYDLYLDNFDHLVYSTTYKDTLELLLNNGGFVEIKNPENFEKYSVSKKEYNKIKNECLKDVFTEYYVENKDIPSYPKECFDKQKLRAVVAFLVLNKTLVWFDSVSEFTILDSPNSVNFDREYPTMEMYEQEFR